MTITEILERVRLLKPMSRETLYVTLRRLRIKPRGARQIPQHYPESTPERIYKRLGLDGSKAQEIIAKRLSSIVRDVRTRKGHRRAR